MTTWATPVTILAGQTAGVAAAFNTNAADLTVLGQAWQTYVPTTTGITLGNGTVTGRYNQVGKTVDFICQFTFGSTSAITASTSFSLPATAQTTGWYASESTAFDTSAVNYWPIAGVATSTGIVTSRVWNATAGLNFSALSSTVPFTWATGDILTVQGRYEAA